MYKSTLSTFLGNFTFLSTFKSTFFQHFRTQNLYGIVCSTLSSLTALRWVRALPNSKSWGGLGQSQSYCQPTPKPPVTRWNSKESPQQLPEEKCPSVIRRFSALFTLLFKLRCSGSRRTPASITSVQGFHSIWISAEEASWTKLDKGSVQKCGFPGGRSDRQRLR